MPISKGFNLNPSLNAESLDLRLQEIIQECKKKYPGLAPHAEKLTPEDIINPNRVSIPLLKHMIIHRMIFVNAFKDSANEQHREEAIMSPIPSAGGEGIYA